MTTLVKKQKKSAPTRILLVDDHPLLRTGIALLLNGESDFYVCGEATSTLEALEKLPVVNPDLAVVDISLPGADGIALIKQIKHLQPQCQMLVYSGNDEALYAERVLAAGAQGYLMKGEPPLNLLTAIRRVLAGEIVVGKEIANQLLRRGSNHPNQKISSVLDGLTDRELEIFRWIGQDRTRGEIAQQLQISVKTYEAHRANIRRKLYIKNAHVLYRMAVQFQQTQSTDSQSCEAR